MLLVDTEEHKMIQDVELKLKIAQSRPHSDWLKEQVMLLIWLIWRINLGYLYYYIRVLKMVFLCSMRPLVVECLRADFISVFTIIITCVI